MKTKKVLKAVKKIKKAGQVGVAANQLKTDLTNPYNVGKMVLNATQGQGLTYPGSKYIGPGNSMNAGTPTSSADYAARRHDEAYTRMLQSGVRPFKLYGGYSDADSQLIRESDLTTPEGLVTYSGMKVKQAMYKLGMSGTKIKDLQEDSKEEDPE